MSIGKKQMIDYNKKPVDATNINRLKLRKNPHDKMTGVFYCDI